MAKRIIEGLMDFDPDMKIAEGDYLFEIVESSFGTFQKSGREFLELKGEFVDGPEQPSGIEVPGRKQSFRLGLVQPNDKPATKNLMGGRIRKLHDAVGHDSDEIDTEALDGKVVGVRIVFQKDSDFPEPKSFFRAEEFSKGNASSSGSSSSNSIY